MVRCLLEQALAGTSRNGLAQQLPQNTFRAPENLKMMCRKLPDLLGFGMCAIQGNDTSLVPHQLGNVSAFACTTPSC